MKRIESDRTTSTWVGSGSSPPRPSNIASKTGTMKTSMPTRMRMAWMKTTTG